MKLNRRVAAAGVAAACAWMGNAHAAGSATVSVQVSVAAQCIFQAGTAPTISWAYDGSAATPSLTSTATATYRCTNGTSPSFTTGSTAAGLIAGTNTITYSAGVTSGGAGTGMGAAQTKHATVTASLNQASADAAAPGNYTGSFTLTLTP